MNAESTASLQASYDSVTREYAAHFWDELTAKPLDRALLDCFAELVRGQGTVADLGCGPGQIGRYLHDRGLPVLGLDLSPAMVAAARRLSPELEFRQGSMLALDVPDAAWAGIVAFYSIIHIPPDDLPRACAEFARALRAGGYALLAFHVGNERHHLDQWWGHTVALDFQFYEPEQLEDRLTEAGFVVEARLTRRPYEPLEHPSQRGYLLARKPDR
jgi:SAM-dependent methyltransferase